MSPSMSTMVDSSPCPCLRTHDTYTHNTHGWQDDIKRAQRMGTKERAEIRQQISEVHKNIEGGVLQLLDRGG